MKFYDNNGNLNSTLNKATISNIKIFISKKIPFMNTEYASYNVPNPDLSNDSFEDDNKEPEEDQQPIGTKININMDDHQVELVDDDDNVVEKAPIDNEISKSLQDKIVEGYFNDADTKDRKIDDEFINQVLETSGEAANNILNGFSDNGVDFYNTTEIINTLSKEMTSVIEKAMATNPTLTNSTGTTSVSSEIIKGILDKVIEKYFANQPDPSKEGKKEGE